MKIKLRETTPAYANCCYPTWSIDIDGNAVASEFPQLDLTPDDVKSVICDAEKPIADAITKIIRKRLAQRQDTVILAKVTFQQWVHDYAVTRDEATFNCALALDRLPLEELPACADDISDGALDFGDDLYSSAVSLDLIEEWDGPYECRIADNDAYDRYLAKRRVEEHGKTLNENE